MSWNELDAEGSDQWLEVEGVDAFLFRGNDQRLTRVAGVVDAEGSILDGDLVTGRKVRDGEEIVGRCGEHDDIVQSDVDHSSANDRGA